MELDTTRLAFGVGLAALAVWVLCSALIAIAPQLSMTATEHLFHLPAGTFDWNLTWAGFFVGAITWPVVVFLFTWLAAALYNGLVGETPGSSRVPD